MSQDSVVDSDVTFQDFTFKPSLLKAIKERGYVTPTEIQREAIPVLINQDTDLVGQAQTGTGKTAAFVLPLLHKISSEERSVQSLILTPTRELANQIVEEIQKFATYENINALSVYGGVPLDGQIRALKRGKVQIVVGTPGRVMDLIDRGVLKLADVKFAILDEADEMLDMGFFDDVKSILSEITGAHKTWMFSATMPRPILELINDFLQDPVIIKVQKKTVTNENIEQKYFVMKIENQLEGLCRFIDSLDDFYAIIFCRTKIDAKNVCDGLIERGFPCDSLHGDLSQQQRDLTMAKFKKQQIKLLVCTDVAARGIDVDNLTHVINYGLPQDLESYVHRIGRTGRAGQKGVAMSFVSPGEKRKIVQIERMTKAKIEQEKLMDLADIRKKLVVKEFDKLNTITDGSYHAFFEECFTILKEKFAGEDSEALLKKVFHLAFAHRMNKYNNSQSIDIEDRPRVKGNVNLADVTAEYVRMFVSAGKDAGMNVPDLVGFFTDNFDVRANMIRNISLTPKCTFVDVPTKIVAQLLAMEPPRFEDRVVRFEITNDTGGHVPGTLDHPRGGSRGSFGGGRGGRESSGGGYRGGSDRGGPSRGPRRESSSSSSSTRRDRY